MNHFTYRNGALCAEEVPLTVIAEAVGTPFYCYSSATLERHYRVFTSGLAGLNSMVCFAVKANPNIAVIHILAKLGAGADVVSEGELRRALKGGVPADKIVFSGVGKTRRELALALELGIRQINVESEPELDALNTIAQAMGKRATIGIRVNPDVDAQTHAKITTGKKENKFGIDLAAAPALFRKAHAMAGIDLAGIAMHIGSQLTDLSPFGEAFRRMRKLVLDLRHDGIDLRRIDVGGGLGIPYAFGPGAEEPPIPADYGSLLTEIFSNLNVELVLEPGRLLVGNAGVLVARVVYVKQGSSRRFVICDAGMNDLLRPAMYDAYHHILPVTEPAPNAPQAPVDVVGPICESSDVFAKARTLPPLGEGDLIAFATAGAYGSAMSSTYNGRPLVPEVLVKGAQFSVVRERPSYEAMMDAERIPDWS